MRQRILCYKAALIFLFIACVLLPANHGAALTPPVNLTGWSTVAEIYRVERGDDGTVAVFWLDYDAAAQKGTLKARVRPAGKNWGSIAAVSVPVGPVTIWLFGFWDAGITPSGTPWVIWTFYDSTMPAPNMKLKASHWTSQGSWQTEDLSGWVTMLRNVDLDIGTGGDMSTVWTECSTTSSDETQGPCAVNVRRRPYGSGSWLTAQRTDTTSGQGIQKSYNLVGPGGLVVVVWNEALAVGSTQWRVKARAYVPLSGWDASASNVSAWLEPRLSSWLSEPVMGEDGLVITAWNAKTAPGSGNDAQYSSTRSTVSATWTTPAQLSAAHPANSQSKPVLAVAKGTTVAVWDCKDNAGTLYAVFANARDAGSVWGTEAQLSSWTTYTSIRDLDMRTYDGTAMVLWVVEDSSKPGTADEALFWSRRPPLGSWSAEARLGNWMDNINGAALGLFDDGRALALWGVTDAGKPTDQRCKIMSSIRPTKGPWNTPQTVLGDYFLMGIYSKGMRVGSNPLNAVAAYLVIRQVTPPTPTSAVFFSEMKPSLAWMGLLLY